MKIRFLGQSGYILKTPNSEIIIDPYLSDSVSRLAGRPRMLPVPIEPRNIRCDAVICTHEHLDHLDPDTVSCIKNDLLFITTGGGRERLIDLGKENVIALSVGEKITVGDFEINAVFADHTVEAIGLVIKAEGKTLYFSGDTLYNERLFDVAAFKPDVTFICINGRLGNMNVSEALATAKRIGASLSVPNHYDMFASNSEDTRLFSEHIDGGFVMEFDREYQLISTSLGIKLHLSD